MYKKIEKINYKEYIYMVIRKLTIFKGTTAPNNLLEKKGGRENCKGKKRKFYKVFFRSGI
jgi:hypothetical protein